MLRAPIRSAVPTDLRQRRMPHYPVLDGWRGVSILLVLCGHLLPLGPGRLQLNETTAALGMAVFFSLSGFLITSTLLYRPHVREFLIRRVFRIVPLAWLFIGICLLASRAPKKYLLPELLFYANLPPFWLTDITGHLWSLCVEMQFYLLAALLFVLLRKRGLLVLPFLCLGVTLVRIVTHTHISIVTDKRLDEILVGACLALLLESERLAALRDLLQKSNPFFVLPLAYLSCHTRMGPLNYARPYFTMWLVGSTLLQPEHILSRALRARSLEYLASISYALYVLHPLSNHGWAGSGVRRVRDVKRLITMAGIFGLAHLSTKYYEHFWIQMAKRWSKSLGKLPTPSTSASSVGIPKDQRQIAVSADPGLVQIKEC